MNDERSCAFLRELVARGLEWRFYFTERTTRGNTGAFLKLFVVTGPHERDARRGGGSEYELQAIFIPSDCPELRKRLHFRERTGEFYVGGCGFRRSYHLLENLVHAMGLDWPAWPKPPVLADSLSL